MALSKEKVEELLKELEKSQIHYMERKDVDGALSHYHPDAVVIHKGVKAYYGHNEIKECVKGLFQADEANSCPIMNPLYSSSSTDGEYLIRRGTWGTSDHSEVFPFEQIYKKHNGQYLVYHDEFEFSA